MCVNEALQKCFEQSSREVSARRCVCVAGYVDRNNTLCTGKTFTRLRLHYYYHRTCGNVFALGVDVETLSYKESLQTVYVAI